MKKLQPVYECLGIDISNGNFPFQKLKEKTIKICESTEKNDEEKVAELLKMVADYRIGEKQNDPDFTNCYHETANALSPILNEAKSSLQGDFILGRVYKIEEGKKNPILFVCFITKEGEKSFFFANKETKQFTKMEEGEFTQTFACYEKDIKNIYHGNLPWEQKQVDKETRSTLARE